MSKSHILFYISSHGFGHSTRMIEVANHIPLSHKITFATLSPEWLYSINVRRPFSFRSLGIDAGVKQSNFLTILCEETLDEYASILKRREEIIREEAKWIRKNNVTLIIADIPPLAFPIAKKSGLPSLGISNFSWDWIYTPMIDSYPEYACILDAIRNDYKEADLLLRLPVSTDMAVFPKIKDIPFIARKSQRSKKEIRKKLGINESKTLILFSFGGYEMARIDFSSVFGELHDFVIISFNPGFPAVYPGFISIDNQGDILHEEAVCAADIVVCKPGYGIVSECITHQVRVLFTSRKDFRENEILVKGLHHFGIAEEIPNEDFLAGKWKAYIDRLMAKEDKWPQVDCSGAKVALREIISISG